MKFKYKEDSTVAGQYYVGAVGDNGGFHPRYNLILLPSEDAARTAIVLLQEIYNRGRRDKMIEIQKALNTA